MVYILWGEDEFSISETLVKIKRKLGDKAMLALNTAELEGQSLKIAELRQSCESVPFLAEKRLVIVNGLLTRFSPNKEKTGQFKKGSPAADDFKPLADCIAGVPESTVVVLVDVVKQLNNNPLYKAISPGATVQSFPLKRGFELQKWLQEQVAAEGGHISPAAARILAAIGGSNLRSLANEIKKLVLFAGGRLINEQDIKAVVSEAQEFNVFALVDAVFECNAGQAEKILQQLLDKGVNPGQLMNMLSRQVRMLIQAREMREQNKPSQDIGVKLGIFHDFQLRKLTEQADRYSMEQLKYVYRKLLDTDIAIKTGRYDEELALNMMAAELCEVKKA